MSNNNIATFELELRVMNNKLKERRERLGLNKSQIAKEIGIAPNMYSRYERLLESPLCKSGNNNNIPWKPIALKIANYFNCEPENLWPEAVRMVMDPVVTRKITENQLLCRAELFNKMLDTHLSESPEIEFDKKQLSETVEDCLNSLTKRERKVLKMRYWKGMSYDEIKKEFDVTRERIRQIDAKAHRKLQYPTRLKKLKKFI